MDASLGPEPQRHATGRRAAWCFGAVWLLAAVVLLVAGRGADELPAAGATLAGVLAFVWLVCRSTRVEAVASPLPPPSSRPRLWLQVAWLGLVIAITGWAGLVFHHVAAGRVPLWDDVVQAMGGLGERWLSTAWVGSPRNALTNPTAYFVLPVAGLLLLRARFRTLGFGKGHRVLLVTLVVCALPAGWILLHLGNLTPRLLTAAVLGNALQNGPFEEFLFRGALQTRLVPLLGRAWAVVLQALAFGLWHLGAAAHGGGSLWVAAAHTIVSQGTTGLLFGVVMLRTRNLWAGSLLHVLSNTAAQVG